ncbi:hypothetical protein Pfo_022467 [Paulownia fortunei]|nr:hypothetical protein Pfo_022467 [Paulownia fortunei]
MAAASTYMGSTSFLHAGMEKEHEAETAGDLLLRPVEPQLNVKSKNTSREYGGQWQNSTTRNVRIYAAYTDPEICKFDQTHFMWTGATCKKVYSYFQELVDHYEGAPLTEYKFRLIGSDIEHYIRKLLYKGKIQYNIDAKVLNFSMGKPRMGFNYNGLLQDVKY